MVADVTTSERAASDRSNAFLPTARLQISQGLHICVSMGLGYAMGVAAGRASNLFGPATVRLLQPVMAQIFWFCIRLPHAMACAGCLRSAFRRYHAMHSCCVLMWRFQSVGL